MKKLTVAVFSYNRGAYLKFCLESLARNLPQARVVVYDDLSDDPETQAVLAALKVPFVQPTAVAKATHGGLYVNMSRALADAKTEYLLFLQDDMQVVRPVDDQDLADIDAIFAADPNCGFISPVFMKASAERKFRPQYHPDQNLAAYTFPPEADRAAMRYTYADVCIAHVARLRAANFDIVDKEHNNVALAKATFSQMPVMSAPFVFYCPEVPTFRNRRRPMAGHIAGQMARLARQSARLGFVDMTAGEVAAMRARDRAIWPFAEDFLTQQNPKVRKPFVFQDFQGPLALRILQRVEHWVFSGRRRWLRLRAKIGV